MNLSNRLKELRNQYGYSQTELANYLNVTKQAISKWENGLSLPENEKLYLMAKLYGISIDEILGNASNKKKVNYKAILIGVLCLSSCLFFYAGIRNLHKINNQVIDIAPTNPNNPTGMGERIRLDFGSEFDETKAVDLKPYTTQYEDVIYFEKVEAILLENRQVRFRITLNYDKPYMFYAVGGSSGEYFDFYSEDEITEKELIFDLDCMEVIEQGKGILLTIESDEIYGMIVIQKEAASRLKNENF